MSLLVRFAIAASLSALATPSLGADAVVGEEPELPEAPPAVDTTDWGGFYLGAYGGYAWISPGVSTGPVPDGNGLDAGVYGGYNWQFNPNFVGGLELTAGLSQADSNSAAVAVEQEWDASLRARMGYAFERSLIYSFAGLAVTSVDATAIAGADTQTLTGWNVGAGWEQDLGSSWSAKLEYGFADYSSEGFNLGGPAATQIELQDQSVTLGLGFRF